MDLLIFCNFLKIFEDSGFLLEFCECGRFCSKSGLPGESGTALFKDRDYYCRVPNTGD
jgi:hypothetical protein